MENTVWVVTACFFSNDFGFKDKVVAVKASEKEANDFVKELEKAERSFSTPDFFDVEEFVV